MKKIAFLILAHADPEHLKKLVTAINHKCDIYVHVDKKSKIQDFTELIDEPNIYFIKERVSVHWAHFSMVEAQISLVSEVLKRKDLYTHGIFLSGSCFPIKNCIDIYDYFTSRPDHEFIRYFDMRYSPVHMKQVKYKWFRRSLFNSSYGSINYIDRSIRYLLRKLHIKNHWNHKIIPYFGSQWIALTMDCWDYVYEFHKSNKWFVKMNKSTFSPDEHYFHTIVGNSNYAKKASGLQSFKDRIGTYMMANYHLIDPSLTKWYSINDWEEINKSKKLFVRKLNSKLSGELIEKIKITFLDHYTSAQNDPK